VILFLFFLYRRKSRLRKALEVKKDIPASAETVLNRPDPTEKLPSVISPLYSTTSIELDHQAQSSLSPPTGNNSSQRSHTNPFEDTNSIQTAGTEGSNVIPIALVPNRASLPNSESASVPSSASSFPMRPIRSPDLNLNLDNTNAPDGTQRVGSKSFRSGVPSRYSYHSYMSNASSASDLLNEAPMIMTPMKGSIRQVVGAAKAEVINADSLSSSGGSSDGLNPPAYTLKSVKSPLASTSFGPDDVVSEADETLDAADPFGEESTSIRTTTASAKAHHESSEIGSIRNGLNPPSSRFNVDSRPSSMATQAGSVINISSATRVAIASSPTGTAVPRRTTMGRLVTPQASASSLQEQQQRALAHAHAQAQAQGLDTRRMSGSSVLSAASTRADSILESFPFVPPSPISDRPIRSPPVSPLSQQSFVNSSSSSLYQQTLVVSPPSPLSHQSFTAEPNTTTVPKDSLKLPPPPDRQTQGLSSGSQLSTASSGLSSFPFQIESESVSDASSRPSTLNGRKRASLDTLALTTALSSYPLGFDRDNAYPPKK
jgi:protein OPY2